MTPQWARKHRSTPKQRHQDPEGHRGCQHGNVHRRSGAEVSPKHENDWGLAIPQSLSRRQSFKFSKTDCFRVADADRGGAQHAFRRAEPLVAAYAKEDGPSHIGTDADTRHGERK
jgi:hypothetical protein